MRTMDGDKEWAGEVRIENSGVEESRDEAQEERTRRGQCVEIR